MDKAIEELQLSLAQLDLLNRRSPKGGFEFLIIKKQNLKVKMYQDAYSDANRHSIPIHSAT